MRPAGTKRARARFRRARERAGFSQIGLSRKLERSGGYVAAIENGHLNPSLDQRGRLAELLGVDEAWLFAGFPTPKAAKDAELGEKILKLCGEYSDGEIARKLKIGRGKVRGRRIIAGGETRPSLPMLRRALAAEGKSTASAAAKRKGLSEKAVRKAIDQERLPGEKIHGPFGPHEFVYAVVDAEFDEAVAKLPQCRHAGCDRVALAKSGCCSGPHARGLETRGEWWASDEGKRFLEDYAAGKLSPTCWLCGAPKRNLAPAHFAKAWREERRMVCGMCEPLWITALCAARSRATVARSDIAAVEAIVDLANAFEAELRCAAPVRRGQPRHVALDLIIEALFVGRELSNARIAALLTRAINRGLLQNPGEGAALTRDYVKTRQRRAKIKRRAVVGAEY